MQYDPIKRSLGVVFNSSPRLRILFYHLFAGLFIPAAGPQKQFRRTHFMPRFTIRRRMVTVVPFPGVEDTRNSCMKLCMMVKPMPDRS